MTAFLGELLILDLDRGRARLLVAAYRMLHVQQAAEAGIRIGDQRNIGDRVDQRYRPHHVAIGGQPDIGQAVLRLRHPVAGHVERVEWVLRGEAG